MKDLLSFVAMVSPLIVMWFFVRNRLDKILTLFLGICFVAMSTGTYIGVSFFGLHAFAGRTRTTRLFGDDALGAAVFMMCVGLALGAISPLEIYLRRKWRAKRANQPSQPMPLKRHG